MLSGKDKGKQGAVSMVARLKNSVMVQGVNTVSFSPTLPSLAFSLVYLMSYLYIAFTPAAVDG